MRRFVLIEPSLAVAGPLQEVLTSAGYSPVTHVKSLGSGAETLAGGDVDVVVFGPSLEVADCLELAERLTSTGSPATVIVAEDVTASLLRDAMRAGVSDVISAHDPVDEIVAAMGRASSEAARRRPVLVDQGSAPSTPPQDLGRIVTVFSTKGGVGKTVISTNLAVALAKKWEKRVAILDLDLQFGDVAIMLGLEPKHTINDILPVFDRLDADMLRGFLVEHDSGVKALLAPLRPEDAENISVNRASRVLDLLREIADIVIVDTSPAFSEVVLAALDRSDDVYVVTMMDVASIKNTRISLQKLKQLGFDENRIRLVLNRADSKVFLKASEVEAAIGGEIVSRIPSDLLVPRSVNKGVPVVLDAPRTDVARSLLALAEEIVNRSAVEVEDVA